MEAEEDASSHTNPSCKVSGAVRDRSRDRRNRSSVSCHFHIGGQHDKLSSMEFAPLANNLRRLRDAAGLSQAELAERTGISRVAYRSIETGASQPRTSTLASLAAALGVKIP